MANIKADEISKILREQIENYEQAIAVDEVGAIISVGDGIARVHGLERVMAGEMLAFPHDVYGIALNLEEEEVGVVLLGETTELKEGDVVKRTNAIMSVPVGDAPGTAAGRQGSHCQQAAQSARAPCPGGHRSPAGARAVADGHQSD